MINERSTYRSKEEDHIYLLSGLIKCKQCGRTLNGESHVSGANKKRIYTYSCPKHKDGLCNTKEINCLYIENVVLDSVVKIINENVDESIYKKQRNGILRRQNKLIDSLKKELKKREEANNTALANAGNPKYSEDMKNAFLKSYADNTVWINENKSKLSNLEEQYKELLKDDAIGIITKEQLLGNRIEAKTIIRQIISDIVVDESNNEILINFK